MAEKDSDDKEVLLTEYKLAQEMTVYYGKSLWQIGSIIFAASLAGFAFGFQKDLFWINLIFLNSFLTVLLVGFYLVCTKTWIFSTCIHC